MKKINLKPSNKLDINFSMSSMSDIVFLLLIFFMISASFETIEGINFDLPQSKVSNEVNDNITVMINAKNEYFIDSQKVTVLELNEILKNKFINFKSNPRLLIQADKNVFIKHIVDVANLAKSISNKSMISIATKP